MSNLAEKLEADIPPFYVEKFSLSRDPFSENCDGELFFEDDTRQEILKKLAHLTEFTKLVLFVQGAQGLGKTALLQHRIQTARNNWRTCYIDALQCRNPESFLRKLRETLCAKSIKEDAPTVLAAIQEELDTLHANGKIPLLIIDNIESLNPGIVTVLTPLIAHSSGSKPRVRLIISGVDIPSALSDAIPREEGIESLKYLPLPPLSEKHTADYIKHRLRVCGYTYLEPFNKEKVAKVYLGAKGFPNTVNTLAAEVFNKYAIDYENQKPMINIDEKTNQTLKFSAIGLSVLIIIVLLFALLGPEDNRAPELLTIDQTTQQLAIPEAQTPEPEPVITNEDLKKLSPKAVIPPAPAETVAKEPVKSEPAKLPSVTSEIAKTVVPEPAQDISLKTEDTTSEKPLSSTTKKDKNWIIAQNPQHYTLQLIGGSSERSALRFIEKHQIEEDATVFHTVRNGMDWYAVIYNSYATGKEAREAVANMPPNLKNIKPWIRSFQQVQQDIQ